MRIASSISNCAYIEFGMEYIQTLKERPNNQIVAGGGGGGGYMFSQSNVDASITTTGNNGYQPNRTTSMFGQLIPCCFVTKSEAVSFS